MIFPGEKEALEQIDVLAEKYGYGNVIAFLKMKWLDKLEAAGGPRDDRAVNVSPYRKGFVVGRGVIKTGLVVYYRYERKINY